MKHMTTLKDHDRRIATLEARTEEHERTFSDSLYKLHRFRARTELRWAKLLDHFQIADVTEDNVDEFLDAE